MRFAPLLAAFVFAAGLVGFSAATGQLPPPKAKSADGDLVRLQGEWSVTKVELPGGEAPPDEMLKDLKISVRENRITAEFTGKSAGKEKNGYALLMLDSTKTPRHVDVTMTDEKWQPWRDELFSPGKDGKVKYKDLGPEPARLCAYRLDGDALTVCVPLGRRSARPTELKVAPPKDPKSYKSDDRGTMLIQLTRKK
ncbi:MAG TPA: TIGR03067 domain-containing protein [Urbifossiella sp.]|nr:TIGR03067 domain-containing protein [Urbifossiella sp.]